MKSLIVFVLLLGLSYVFSQTAYDMGAFTVSIGYQGTAKNFILNDTDNDYDQNTETSYYPCENCGQRSSYVTVSYQDYTAGQNVVVYGFTGATIQIQWEQIHTVQQIGVPCSMGSLATPLAGGFNYSATCPPKGPTGLNACFLSFTVLMPGIYYFQDPAPSTSQGSQTCMLFDIANMTPSPSLTSSTSFSTSPTISITATATVTQTPSSSSTISTTTTASASFSSSVTPTPSPSFSSAASQSSTSSSSLTSSISVSFSSSISTTASASVTQTPSSSSTISTTATASASLSASASISVSPAPSQSPLPCRHPDATRSRALSWLAEVKCDHSVINDTNYDTTPFIREYSVAQGLGGCHNDESVFGDCSGTILFYHTCRPLTGKGTAACNRQKDYLAASVTFTCDLTVDPAYTCYPETALDIGCPSASNVPTHF